MGRLNKFKQTSRKIENQKIESKKHIPSANKCKVENQKNIQQVKDKIHKKLNQSKKSAKTIKKINKISASEERACRKDAVRKMCKIKSDGRAQSSEDQTFCYKKFQQTGQDRPQPSRIRTSCKEKDPKTGELYEGKLVDREKGKLLHSRHHAKQPEHDEDWDVGREYEYLRPGSHSR